jgi:hypothetical protein
LPGCCANDLYILIYSSPSRSQGITSDGLCNCSCLHWLRSLLHTCWLYCARNWAMLTWTARSTYAAGVRPSKSGFGAEAAALPPLPPARQQRGGPSRQPPGPWRRSPSRRRPASPASAALPSPRCRRLRPPPAQLPHRPSAGPSCPMMDSFISPVCNQ